eukprot:CAMPEP_0117803632 /NCGR_PEP_ID=MMETSP0948-20121206/16548_1 /TAXON_ID=44440 /ORGANISM="Chattonella subsalsa, Strain CCMP2191" /LENGTH=99 /DNA_ID=CAMNT_0005636873 /DNA_START=691 /DNA_END=989 /DNA_ORIENTATION=+
MGCCRAHRKPFLVQVIQHLQVASLGSFGGGIEMRFGCAPAQYPFHHAQVAMSCSADHSLYAAAAPARAPSLAPTRPPSGSHSVQRSRAGNTLGVELGAA